MSITIRLEITFKCKGDELLLRKDEVLGLLHIRTLPEKIAAKIIGCEYITTLMFFIIAPYSEYMYAHDVVDAVLQKMVELRAKRMDDERSALEESKWTFDINNSFC